MKARHSPFSARFAGLLLLTLLAFTGPAVRAAPPPLATASLSVPLADSVSWHGFSRYWTSFVKNADRVLLIVALVAAAALFIITRGKWL